MTVALLAVLYWLIRHTRDGQFMLAVADNDKLAEIYGISAKRAYLLSGVVAAVLICAGVYLYGTRAGVTPDVPIGLMLTAVIATLVGGSDGFFPRPRGGRAGAVAEFQHPVHPGDGRPAAVFLAVLRPRCSRAAFRLAHPPRQAVGGVRRGAGGGLSRWNTSPTPEC